MGGLGACCRKEFACGASLEEKPWEGRGRVGEVLVDASAKGAC